MKSQRASVQNPEEQLFNTLGDLAQYDVDAKVIEAAISEISELLQNINQAGSMDSVEKYSNTILDIFTKLKSVMTSNEAILHSFLKAIEALRGCYQNLKQNVGKQTSIKHLGPNVQLASRLRRETKQSELENAITQIDTHRQEIQQRLDDISRDKNDWLPEDENRIADIHHYMEKAAYQWCFPKSQDYPAWVDLSSKEQEAFLSTIHGVNDTFRLSGQDSTSLQLVESLRVKADNVTKSVEADGKFQTVITFGDSVMDQGNMERRLIAPLAGLGQSRDGAFSDGLNWVGKATTEYVLAKMILRNPESMKAAFDKQKIKHFVKGSTYNTIVTNDGAGNPTLRVKNYAEGGASAARGTNIAAALMKTLSDERDEFLADRPVQEVIDKSKTLIFEMTGANDMVTVNSSITDANMDRAVSSRVENIQKLYGQGYRNFILGSLPDLTLTAYFQNMSAGEQAHAYRVATRYNQKIVAAVEAIKIDKDMNGINVHVYDISQAFIGAYSNEQDKDPSWRKNRLNRTDLLDAEIQKKLGLTKNEYNALQDTGLVAQLARVYRNVNVRTSAEINREINTLVTNAKEGIQTQLGGMNDDVSRDRQDQQAESRGISRGKLRRQLRTQFRRQKRALAKVFAKTYTQAELSKLGELFNDRENAYFYNGLHPSSILYEAIEKDMLTAVATAARVGMNEAFKVNSAPADSARTLCLTKVYAREALQNITDTGRKTPSFDKDMQSFKTMLESTGNESSTAELIFTAFMKDYTGKIASDFSSLAQDSMRSRLGSVLTPDNKSIDKKLTDVFYHALFNGGRRSRKALQNLGYLTSPACQVGTDLLTNERRVVVQAVREAYKRALENKADNPTVKRRLKQLDGQSMKFEKALTAQEKLMTAKAIANSDPKLTRCIDLYAQFYFKRTNTRFAKPSVSLLETFVNSCSNGARSDELRGLVFANRLNSTYTQQQRDDLNQAIKDSGLDDKDGAVSP